MTEQRPFRIVTHRNWLAETFAPFGAVQDFGFDIDPETCEQTMWWAPSAWAACVWQSGIRLPLTSCGHTWMTILPWEYVRRGIHVCTTDNITDLSHTEDDYQVHVKLTEAKLESFPARLHHRKRLKDTIAQYGLPANTWLQLSEPVNFTMECRFWIANGAITTGSWYLVDGVLWDHEDFKNGPPHVFDRMILLVTQLLTDRRVKYPNGFVLDVGLTDEDQVLVVEANASWSSSPYTGRTGGIVESIAAAHDFDNQHSHWRWFPNPVYDRVQPIKWAKGVK